MLDPGGIERQIKRLLISSKSGDRQKGFVLLDKHYRDLISGSVRTWSNRHGVPIDSEELADIYQATLLSVARNVKSGHFKMKGRLKAYLRKIAHRRAVDLVRKRILTTVNWTDLPRAEGRPPAEQLPEAEAEDRLSELLEEIESCVDRLPKRLQIVIELDVKLFLEESKWVSLKTLTDEVNRRHEQSLSTSAVSSRRQRAREKLAQCLEG